MQKRFVVYVWLGVVLLAATAVTAQQPKGASATAAKHPFGAQDWIALRSAHATSDRTLAPYGEPVQLV
jgi:hypothetical protein